MILHLSLRGPRPRWRRASTLPPELAAASLDYYGQVLIDRSDNHGAKQAFVAAVRIDGSSPAGRDALKRLRTE